MNGLNGLDLGVIHFLRPLWLLGLLALPVLVWAWRVRARRRSAWRDVVDPHLLPYLLEDGLLQDGTRPRGSGISRMMDQVTLRCSGSLALIALGLVCIALAGPGWRKIEQPLWHAQAPLVVALDLSSAALTSDLPPSRLAQMRSKLAQLLRERQGGQVALLVYAEDAYTVAPLTDDVANVALFLDALDPEVMPVDGRRVDRAIARSQRLLRQAGFERGDIVLFAADAGEADADARRAAAAAARAGFRVNVLGLGTPTGAAYRMPDGRIGQARLDEPALRSLARAGDGVYARLRPDAGDLAALAVLDPTSAVTRSASATTTTTWEDQGYWLLLPVLLLAALAFRRGAVLATLLACLWLPSAPIRAQDGSLWQRPDQQAYARMQQGWRAYREADYAAAGTAFKDVSGPEGAYNLGNALAKQGRYQDAIAAYDRALAQRPDMDDAIANRKAVLDAMQRQPPPGGGRNQSKPQGGQAQSKPRPDPGEKPGDNPDGQGDPDQAQQTPRQAGKPSQPDRADRGAQAGAQDQPLQPTQADQGAADAAQRQRMRQALAQRPQARDEQRKAQDAGQRAEQAVNRERSLATEALLKRVPDDPGALLRAKFQLEYERRRDQGDD